MCSCTAVTVEFLECAIEHVDFIVCSFVRWLSGHFSHSCAMHCGILHPQGILLASSTSLPTRFAKKNASQIVARPSNYRGNASAHVPRQMVRWLMKSRLAACANKKVLQNGARLVLPPLMCQGECCGGRGDPGVHAQQRQRMCCKLAQGQAWIGAIHPLMCRGKWCVGRQNPVLQPVQKQRSAANCCKANFAFAHVPR